jgi:SAM-dependent methyltransferase
MEERWETETPYFRDIILSQLNEGSTILDYGCGVGRIAKAILEVRPDLEIYGVDASPEMLKLAKEYVNSDRFITSSPIEFSGKVGFAYCAYVLQHIPSEYVEGAVKQISESTDRLLLVNSVGRMVATSQGFVNDGLDIFELTAKYFPKCRWAIPGEVLIDSKLMRKMFMGSPLAGTEGNTLHYAFIFEKA